MRHKFNDCRPSIRVVIAVFVTVLLGTRSVSWAANSLQLVSPAPGITLGGNVVVSWKLNSSASGVDLYVDSAHIIATSECWYIWDSTASSNGKHTITARAFSSTGVLLAQNSATVNVANVLPTRTPVATPTRTRTPTPTPTATAIPSRMSINGVYDLTNFNQTIPSSILANKSIDGVSIRVTGWSTVEPSEGVFDWSKLDAMIAQVTSPKPIKKIEITIPAGYTTPKWVYDDGAHSYSWIWDRSWGPAVCSVARMPLPWDPVFQSKWSTLVAAFGAKYKNNPQVASIKLTGPNNGPDPELWLPHQGSVGIGTGNAICSNGSGFQCCSYNNDQNWINAGYTRTKMESAMTWDMQQFSKAFPSTPFAIEADPCSIPAIDNNGAFFSTPGNCGDTQGVEDIVNQGIQTYGRRQFVVQNDGLQTYPYIELAAFWSLMEADSLSINTGYQFAWPVGLNDFSGITQTGIDYGAKFIEFYQTDLTNSGNANEITSAHNQLIQAQ